MKLCETCGERSGWFGRRWHICAPLAVIAYNDAIMTPEETEALMKRLAEESEAVARRQAEDFQARMEFIHGVFSHEQEYAAKQQRAVMDYNRSVAEWTKEVRE